MATGWDSEIPQEIPDQKERRQRGNGKVQLSVTFEYQNGDSETIWYSHIYRMTLAGDTLVIRFSDNVVTLTGRNLRLLRNHIAVDQVDIVKAEPESRDFGKDGWAVYSIAVK